MQNSDDRKLTPAEKVIELQRALAAAKEERWKRLCEQAASETDPEKLVLLMREFDLMLEERQRQLKGKAPSTDRSPIDRSIFSQRQAKS